MKQGKYLNKRYRRKKRINWTGVIFWLVILAVIIAGIALLSKSCSQGDAPAYTDPPTLETQGTLPPTQPPTQAPTTEPATEPPTQEPTEPPTEEPTEPPTEEPTEPETEPETEPPTQPPTEIDPPDYDEVLGQSVVDVANSVLGKPYLSGGSSPEGFDTSGFIYYCFRQCDIAAPRSIGSQYKYGEAVPKDSLEPGDVVFFWLNNPGKTEYVGIYVGDDTFIAVSSSKNAVEEKNIDSKYFAERYIGARRYS